MNEMFDAGRFQVVHACGSAGYHKQFFASGQLERFGSEGRIFVIARTEYDDIGILLTGRFHSGLYGFKAEVVENLVARTSEEV